MNKFDERYDIRLAEIKDIPIIMKFIGEFWRENHILSYDRNLFEYEYVYENQVNFIVAIDKEKKTLEGIFGFLNASNPNNADNKDIWGSIWKVKENNLPLLGVELTKRVLNLTGCRMQIGNGANPKTTVPLRKRLFKDYINKLEHYYLLNPSITEFKIAKINERKNTNYKQGKELSINLCTSINEIEESFDLNLLLNCVPYKDLWYINKRFFNHPYYQYNIFSIKCLDKENVTAILVGREVKINNNRIFRIVDYYGDRQLFESLGNFFRELLEKYNYEYIDFYTFGFEQEYILNAGFILKLDDTNIIPNYFDPFVQSNVDIWINYSYENTIFFKADSDQDRPNIGKRK